MTHNFLTRWKSLKKEIFTLNCLGCLLLSIPILFALLYILAVEACILSNKPSSMSILEALEFGGVACFWIFPLLNSVLFLIFIALILLRNDESKRTVSFLRQCVFLLAAYAILMGYALTHIGKQGHELLACKPQKSLMSWKVSAS